MTDKPVKERYLTKSRFKLGLECVTKLYYTKKSEEYADNSLDDPFLMALAEGGFQVGELAKYMFCEDPVADAITVDTLDYKDALRRTNEMLARPGKVVIAEGAFVYNNLFIRADIVVKEGNRIDLYEVKAKSFEGEGEEAEGINKETPFISYKNKDNECVNSKWRPYLYDLAFQKYVITKSMPEVKVSAFLLMVNKNATSTVEGLNQKFKIFRDGDQKKVVVPEGLKATDLGKMVLDLANLDDTIEKIWNKYPVPTDWKERMNFTQFVEFCEKIYSNNKQEFGQIGKKCRDCQFTTDSGNEGNLKNGFIECWKKYTNLTEEELSLPLVLELWSGGAGSRSFSQELIMNKVFFLKDVIEEQLVPKNENKDAEYLPGLSKLERRMEQVNRVKKGTVESYFDKTGILLEMKTWKWPLHMIDFETSMVALPFHKNTKPYQGIAFQFSHHIMHETGKVEHYDQFLHLEQGVYPNIDFVRALMKSLSVDDGAILRYHNHENTYLNMIYRQLEAGMGKISEGERQELMNFIRDITRWRNNKKDPYKYGRRCMVDLFDLVLRFYYPPFAKGSNSLKQILPSIIRDSAFLRKRYGTPGVYGKDKEIASLNFDDQIWIRDDKKLDPYKTLPPIFEGIDRDKLDNLVKDFEGVADGGAALTAYNYLQFSEVPAIQRDAIGKALLKYCELDTLAMVMIVEGWREWECN